MHSLCGVALSERWLGLVATAAIGSTARLVDGRSVKYGLRLDAQRTPVEFALDAELGDDVMPPLRCETTADGFTVELRPNRALRPPPALRLGEMPPHEEATCSFCAGPLRLAVRPMVAQVTLSSGRTWDVHYNISPMDPNGHYLLVPDISVASSRRRQFLTREDCEVSTDHAAASNRAVHTPRLSCSLV